MVSFAAQLPQPALAAIPGRVAACDLIVTNPSDAPATFEIDVRGGAGRWALVLPASLDVPAGGAGRARLAFTVPDPVGVQPGPEEFTVQVSSGPERVEVPGTIEVAALSDVRLRVSPLISRAPGRTRHTVHVANRGNLPALVPLTVEDRSGRLDLALSAAAVDLLPGQDAMVELLVSPRRRCLGRQGRSHRLAVTAQPDRGSPVTAEALFHQEPARWRTPTAIALLLVAVTGLLLMRAEQPPAPGAAAQPAALVLSNCPEDVAGGQVLIPSFVYCPGDITVTAGGDVAWQNADAAPHTVTGASFDSGALAQGQSFRMRFEQPGTYSYFCRFHPGMTGTVKVIP